MDSMAKIFFETILKYQKTVVHQCLKKCSTFFKNSQRFSRNENATNKRSPDDNRCVLYSSIISNYHSRKNDEFVENTCFV